MFGYEGKKSYLRTFWGGGYEVKSLLFKHGIDEGKLEDMKVLTVYINTMGTGKEKGFTINK